QLQRTRLEEVQRAFGGTIYEEGRGTGIARWLCYESPQATTWLMSNSLGGGIGRPVRRQLRQGAGGLSDGATGRSGTGRKPWQAQGAVRLGDGRQPQR